MTIETKNLSFQIKAAGVATNAKGQEVGQIEAYGAVFNNVDDGGDRILPGAFVRTIKNSKARAKTREKDYILKMLWQHKSDEVIGGWTDLAEDSFGLLGKGDVLLATQRGREYYELAKAGMVDEFSIIYETPDMEWVKSGVTPEHRRDLKEIRLYSIDPITFAMNDETLTVNVKSLNLLEEKAVCGNTSGPIGPRDESWDGGKAKRQIWAAAAKEDGTINTALAKKYFMVCDGDAQTKGSYSYPFWYVGSDPHICVGAVKAIAAAVQGARGANAPDGLKSKVETLYGRINRKYPDDTALTPPWKGSTHAMQKKTFAEHLAEEMCEDLLEDFQDVLVCALCCAILDAFKVGDQPEADVKAALAEFGDAVSAWVAQAMEYGLSEYLDARSSDWSPADYTMQYGSESRPDYGYMSRSRSLGRKAGRAISAATADTLQGHIDDLHGMADDHMKAVKAHVKAVHATADGMAGMLPAADSDGKEPNADDGTKAAPFTRTRRAEARPEASTVTDDEIAAAYDKVRSIRQPLPQVR